jgi:Na+:H+ antiporter, NhaA family
MDKSQSTVINKIINPFQRFFKLQASGGIFLLIVTILALVIANSPLYDLYYNFFHTKLTIGFGEFKLSKYLLLWINDGLMGIFFFVVGLEIKREIIAGELSSFKKASLPIAAALGGLIIPALFYIVLNYNQPGMSGWGIPMATDIAFSIAILMLLGDKVPIGLKVFLTAFAIVDDIGAVMVIALFYSGEIQWNLMFIAAGIYGLLLLINFLNIRIIVLYVFIGAILWYLFLMAGIHPTIAGILLAFTIPVKRKIKLSSYIKRIKGHLGELCEEACQEKIAMTHDQLEVIDNIQDDTKKVQSPLQALEHGLHGFVVFFIMPVFAFANAGVQLVNDSGDVSFGWISISLGIALVFGKAIGISLFSWISLKLKWAQLPDNVVFKKIIAMSFLGGVGFTMSIFITNLAFTNDIYIDQAKTGILIFSFISGLVAYIILRNALKNH